MGCSARAIVVLAYPSKALSSFLCYLFRHLFSFALCSYLTVNFFFFFLLKIEPAARLRLCIFIIRVNFP